MSLYGTVTIKWENQENILMTHDFNYHSAKVGDCSLCVTNTVCVMVLNAAAQCFTISSYCYSILFLSITLLEYIGFQQGQGVVQFYRTW